MSEAVDRYAADSGDDSIYTLDAANRLAHSFAGLNPNLSRQERAAFGRVADLRIAANVARDEIADWLDARAAELATVPAPVVESPAESLVLHACALPAGPNPAAVYLAGLVDGPGRVAMRSTLGQVAAMLGGSTETVPWHELRHRHVAGLRARFA